MKRSVFFPIFFGILVVFIFLYIRKASQCMDQSYRKQELEETKKRLVQQKQNLTAQLYTAKSRSAIKEYAEQKLNMAPISIKQVKKLHVS